jgi:signal transduction histidine kinase
MIKRGTLPDTDLRTAALIARNADRMAKMISQLLDFTRSRLGGGIPIHPRPVELAGLCTELIAECEAANPGRAFSFTADVDTNGHWDRDRLAQVIANLLGNAVKYGALETPITVRVVDEGDAVTLSVHNAGPPISAETLPSIFEPFRRGTRHQTDRTESLGLGLFIATEIVRAHAGQIDVRSSEAEGTTFTVRLPRRA